MWRYNPIWVFEIAGQMTCLAAIMSSNAAGVNYLLQHIVLNATGHAITKLVCTSWAWHFQIFCAYTTQRETASSCHRVDAHALAG